jgi:Mor family transcriptional regulator
MDDIETAIPAIADAPPNREGMVSQDVLDNADLVDAIFAFIEEEFPQMASRTAQLKDEVRREFSGVEIYIPRRSHAARDKLTRDVLKLFNGRNATEIARRLGIGRATVYRIIKQEGNKK